MTPNSVKQLAPSSVYMPPATHNKTIANGACSCSATRPGVRRIPTPTVPPILTARPKPTPKTRRSRPDVSDTIAVLSVSVLRAAVSLNLLAQHCEFPRRGGPSRLSTALNLPERIQVEKINTDVMWMKANRVAQLESAIRACDELF